MEVVTPVLPLDKGKGWEVEAEALLVEPTPEPVPSSEEEEEEEETLEVIRSDTPLPGLEPVPTSTWSTVKSGGACAQHF